MPEKGDACCYRAPPGIGGNKEPCQFMDEPGVASDLVTVDGRAFCRYHLPYSVEEMEEDYGPTGLVIGRDQLKQNWISGQVEAFNDDIKHRLHKARHGIGKTDLTGVVFPGVLDCANNEFSKVCFRAARFSGGPAIFDHAIFMNCPAIFDHAQFTGGAATFKRIRLYGRNVQFSHVHFRGDADFAVAITGSDPGSDAYAFGQADFQGVRFDSAVSFENRIFQNSTSFERAAFGRAPVFHGATLHQDTTFPPIQNFRDTSGTQAAHAYRTLRLAMKQQEAHDEEAMFWVLEQRSKRTALDFRRPADWLPWILSWGYEGLSAYGSSISRPLVCLGVWISVLSLIYAGLDGTYGAPNPEAFHQILGFSVSQTVRPFFIWGDYEGKAIAAALGANVDPLSVKLVATLDGVGSLILFTLLILAIRRRFRMV